MQIRLIAQTMSLMLLLPAGGLPGWAALNQPVKIASGMLQGTPGKNPR
jgi:hypothetical protein